MLFDSACMLMTKQLNSHNIVEVVFQYFSILEPCERMMAKGHMFYTTLPYYLEASRVDIQVASLVGMT